MYTFFKNNATFEKKCWQVVCPLGGFDRAYATKEQAERRAALLNKRQSAE